MDEPILTPEEKEALDSAAQKRKDDYERFGKHTPLVTVLRLCVGPLLFNLTHSFQDAIDYWMIKLAYDETGLSIIGFANFFRYLCNGMASFPGQSTIIKVSSLLGEKRHDEAAQVVTDLFRFSAIICIIVPIIIYLCARPIMIFMSCPEKWIPEAIQYAIPVCVMMFMTSIFRVSCGMVLGEGRSILYAFMHVIILACNCFIFDPIFLVWLRLPLWTVAVSYCLSLGLPGTILMILIYSGKFTVKPTWRMFLNKPSIETWHAIKLSFSNLLTFLTGAFASMVFYRYLYIASGRAGVPEMTAVMPVTIKIYNLIGEITIGLAAGMLSAGAWAFSARKYHRVLWLGFWAVLLAVIQQVLMTPIMLVKPTLITQIWLSSEASKRVCDKYMPIIFYANMLLAIHETGTDMLLATNRPYLAMVPIATRGVCFTLGSYIYWLGGKDDPASVLFVFPSIDIAMFLAVCCLLPKTLKRLFVSKDAED